MSNLNQNILDVVKDAEFAKRVSELKTPEEVQAAFKEKGVDITLQDVDVIAAAIKQKLEDDAIGSVAGGGVKDWFWASGTKSEMKDLGTDAPKDFDDKKGKTMFKEGTNYYQFVEGTSGHLTTAGKIGAGVGGAAVLAATGYGLYKGAKDIYAKIKGNKEK